MNIKPMIFNTEMVRALLDGRKVQTRRPIKPAPEMVTDRSIATWEGDPAALMRLLEQAGRKCPYGQPGDLIYVRETFSETDIRTAYKADSDDGIHCIVKRWAPSIQMPRWASRLTLKVTGVRVERVASITLQDAMAEGIEKQEGTAHWKQYDPQGAWRYWESAVQSFRTLWCSIYGDESWSRNDWAWVIDFEVIRQNVDEYLKEQERA